jgi:hypothetical protein
MIINFLDAGQQLDQYYGKTTILATAKDHSSYDDFWQKGDL